MQNEQQNISTNKTSNSPSISPLTVSPEKKEGFIKETLRFVIISLLIVVPFRYFIAQPFVVSGASMDPTFANGEYLIVDQLSYRFEEPQRGDVVIFRYPRDPSKYFIKRIIGLPFEKVDIQNGEVYITEASSTERTKLPEVYLKNDRGGGNGHTVLSGSEYFVMGDNRTASSDSRVWGPLQKRLIVGTPLVRLFPITRLDIHPGSEEVTPTSRAKNE